MTMTDTKVVQRRTALREMSLFEYQGELFFGVRLPTNDNNVTLERAFDGSLLQEPIDLIWLAPADRLSRVVAGWHPRIVKFENGDGIIHHGLNSVYVTKSGVKKRLTHSFALELIESNDGDGELLRNFQKGVE